MVCEAVGWVEGGKAAGRGGVARHDAGGRLVCRSGQSAGLKGGGGASDEPGGQNEATEPTVRGATKDRVQRQRGWAASVLEARAR